MKRLSIYAFALMLISACTIDRENDYDREVVLSFHPAMHIPSKSETIEDYPERQPFAVKVWVMPENDLYLDSECNLREGSWLPDVNALWPDSGKTLTVIGYTPSELFDGCDEENGVICNDYNVIENQTPLLYTDPQTDLDKVECGGVIPMPFNHALAQVDFRVKNRVDTKEKIIVRCIKIDAAAYKGSFRSLPAPYWEVQEEKAPFVFFEGEHKTGHQPEEIGCVWHMIPQTLETKVSVLYEYQTSAGTGFTTTLKTRDLLTTIEPGRHYTYTISVGIDDVIFLQEIIDHRFK